MKPSLRAKIIFALMRILNVRRTMFDRYVEDETRFFAEKVRLQQLVKGPPKLRGVSVTEFSCDGFPVYRVTPKDSKPSPSAVLFHGGSFTDPPTSFHWDYLRELALSGYTAYMPRYPLAPGADGETIRAHCEKAYHAAREDAGGHVSALIGDSAGGTIALWLASSLSPGTQPALISCFSPVCDLSLGNPCIASHDNKDPLIEKAGLHLICPKVLAGRDHRELSPLCLDYRNLIRSGAPLLIFAGGTDWLTFDILLLDERLRKLGADCRTVLEPAMCHDWLLLPVMPEAREARRLVLLTLEKDAGNPAP